VIAAEVTISSPDFGLLEPMLNATHADLVAAGVDEPVELVVADAGYWHQKQMESVINHGIQVLIPPDAGKRRGERPGWEGSAYAHMRTVLQTNLGAGLYAKRKAIDRARVRQHQIQPADRALPTTRKIRRTLRMATNHRHPQPAQAPQTPTRRHSHLKHPRKRACVQTTPAAARSQRPHPEHGAAAHPSRNSHDEDHARNHRAS
jgi:hypothetical protein